MKSIRRYITRRFILLYLLVLIIVSVFGYIRTAHEAEELYDAELAQAARIIMGIVEKPLDDTKMAALRRTLSQISHHPLVTGESEHDENIFGHHYEKKLLFQIYTADGKLLFSSQTPGPDLQTPGYHWINAEPQHWRVFTIFDENDEYWLQTGQSEDVREEITEEAVLKPALWQGLLMLIGVGIISSMLLNRALSPLQLLSSQVASRNPKQLHPLSPDHAPQEVLPLVTALNALLAALDEALERERRFTDDAAHELRTPLTAAQLHLENASQAETCEQRDASMQAAREGLHRLNNLVNQLLMLARLDGKKHLREAAEPVAMEQALCTLIAETYPTAMRRNQQLSLDVKSDWIIEGNKPLLMAMVRNLIENAVR